MRNPQLDAQLQANPHWLRKLIHIIDFYSASFFFRSATTSRQNFALSNIIRQFCAKPVTLAIVAEFSRGKTELINSLLFAETGLRLLPSAPGRTTMSPTELCWDAKGGSYIRLLDIETYLDSTTLADYKRQPECWTEIKLEDKSPMQMQEAFKTLLATKLVSKETAYKMGLWNEWNTAERSNLKCDYIEIPCWRHALISFPHPLLQKGLNILDTPGLNALGCELELTLNILPAAQAILFVLAADTGVTKTDLEMWKTYICDDNGQPPPGVMVVINKIDMMWDDLNENYNPAKDIQNQIKATATILQIEPRQVFAVSAKQALLAKINNDTALLEKSGLQKLEKYLAKRLRNKKNQPLTKSAKSRRYSAV